jgi:hypothetical protein
MRIKKRLTFIIFIFKIKNKRKKIYIYIYIYIYIFQKKKIIDCQTHLSFFVQKIEVKNNNRRL